MNKAVSEHQTSENIILAHDSFTQFGGGERVLKVLHQLYPKSPIYTLAVDNHVTRHFANAEFRPSLLQRLYNLFSHLQVWFVFAPVALRFMRITPAKIILSSSSAYIKALRKPEGSIHINYCHTPTRFLWSDVVYAEHELPVILRPFMKIYFTWLRRWDLFAAKRVDYFIANSKEVQKRIKRFYGRDSNLIYPSINTEFWRPTISKQDYFLIAGRITPYKGYESIIKIFNQLKLPLHVVGQGRYLKYLQSIAMPNILFYGKISDEALRDQYSGAAAFIYPQVEDFGLMPLEAAACGTPTIALAKAGSLETVIPKVTGDLLEEFTMQTISKAIIDANEHPYRQEDMTAHANKFSEQRFKQEIQEYLNQVYEQSYR